MGSTDELQSLVEGLVVHQPDDLLTHHDAHPLALKALLTGLYGRTWIVWEPETIWADLKHIFDKSVSDLTRQKIQAVKTLLSTKGFWTDWEIFLPVCLALNNRIPAPNVLVKPTVAQCFVAVDMAAEIDDFPYSTELAKFLSAVFADEGIVYAPDPVSFIQTRLSDPQYQCMDCGNIDRDEGNRLCDVCLSTNLRRFEANHLESDEKVRLDKIISGEYTHTLDDEDRIDVMGAKLKVAHDYMLFRRAQYADQMAILYKSARILGLPQTIFGGK